MARQLLADGQQGAGESDGFPALFFWLLQTGRLALTGLPSACLIAFMTCTCRVTTLSLSVSADVPVRPVAVVRTTKASSFEPPTRSETCLTFDRQRLKLGGRLQAVLSIDCSGAEADASASLKNGLALR